MSLDIWSDDAEGIGHREIEEASRRQSRNGWIDIGRIGLGLLGGLVATVAMTVFRMPITDSPPPTANFWAKFVGGGEPEEHTLVGLVLHLGYGAGGGVIFASLAPVSPIGSELSNEVRGVASGLVYGLLLSVFGERVILEALLGMDPEPDERFVFLVSHVIYGLTLGTWVGSKID